MTTAQKVQSTLSRHEQASPSQIVLLAVNSQQLHAGTLRNSAACRQTEEIGGNAGELRITFGGKQPTLCSVTLDDVNLEWSDKLK